MTEEMRKVMECVASDIRMLAVRTQAMTPQATGRIIEALYAAAEKDLVREIHVALFDRDGSAVKGYKYMRTISPYKEANRPGGNRWPVTPGGMLEVCWVPISTGDDLLLFAQDKAEDFQDFYVKEVPLVNKRGRLEMTVDPTRFYASGPYNEEAKNMYVCFKRIDYSLSEEEK